MLNFLKHYSDLIILGTLGVMSFLMLYFVIERWLFLRKVNVENYANIYDLKIATTKHMNIISTVGANAPYVGLLGTVIGILLTFYDLGMQGGDLDAGAIMVNLSLALKATALGILVAIPAMVFYNLLNRKIEVGVMEFHSLHSTKK